MTGEYRESVRDHYTARFLVAPVEGGTEILFSGALMMTVEKDDRLPAGFHDRLVRTVMDLLTNRVTTLWDEQAIFGDRERDMGTIRQMAADMATEAAADREMDKP